MSAKQKSPASNSVRRSNSSYKKTPDTTWTIPADSAKSEPTSRNKHRSKHETPHRLSDRSKTIKHMKTPAQDRLRIIVNDYNTSNENTDNKKDSSSGKNDVSSDNTGKSNKRKGVHIDRSLKECCDDKSAANQKTSSTLNNKTVPISQNEISKRRKLQFSPKNGQSKDSKRDNPLVKRTVENSGDYDAYNSPIGIKSNQSETFTTPVGRNSVAFTTSAGRNSGGSETFTTPIGQTSGSSKAFLTTAARASNGAAAFVTPVGRKRYRVDTPTTRVGQHEIPRLFASKTPAQDRLKRGREYNNSKGAPTKQYQNIFDVFRNEFGIKYEDDVEMTTTNDMVAEENAMDWEPSDDPVGTLTRSTALTYIVPDTNVFISSLDILRRAIDGDMAKKNCILVPFVVLQELDHLKHKEKQSVSRDAAVAITFLYEHIKSKKNYVQGQKATEDHQLSITASNSDDRILNCCIQLRSQSLDVILLTNDKNLSSKTMSSDIKSLTSKEYLETLRLP